MSQIKMILDHTVSAGQARPIYGDLEEPVGADFDFVILGDRTAGAAYQMFERGLELAASLRPSFLLSVGDLVEGYWTDEAEADNEWDSIDAKFRALGIPTLLTAGNHDFGTKTMVDVWRRRWGVDYYAVRYGPLLILVANSEAGVNFEGVVPETILRWNRYNIDHPRQHTAIADLVHHGPDLAARKYPDLFDEVGGYRIEAWADAHEIAFIQAFNEKLAASEEFRHPANLVNPALSDEQLAFFERVLHQHADATWTLLCLHQPAWKKPDQRFQRLEALLSDRPYTVVAGHTHLLDVETLHGRQYINMGKTGGLHCFDGKGDIHHVMLVQVRNGIPDFLVVQYDDDVRKLPVGAFVTDGHDASLSAESRLRSIDR